MLKKISAVVAATAAIGTGFMAAPTANAATVNCPSSSTVSRFVGANISALHVQKVCHYDTTLKTNVASGYDSMGTKNIAYVNYGPKTSQLAINKMTLNDVSHIVDFHTTAAARKAMYKYVGVNLPAQNKYQSISDTARKNLTESIVRCTYPTSRYAGLKLVPLTQCKPFLTAVRAAAVVAK